MSTVDADRLRSSLVYAVDGEGSDCEKWSVWRCLVGSFVVDGDTYVLDEGDFYRVRAAYLEALDATISALPCSDVPLPPTTPTEHEGTYNKNAAAANPDLLLLDKRTIRITGKTTAIEICDLLSNARQLVHVKRHLGSSDLSHLFAQGLVSAELLQSSVDFRAEARKEIAKASGGRDGFDVFPEEGIVPSQFEIVYAIAERWNGRTVTQGLPFFSKVNLREASANLRARGFRVCVNQIQA